MRKRLLGILLSVAVVMTSFSVDVMATEIDADNVTPVEETIETPVGGCLPFTLEVAVEDVPAAFDFTNPNEEELLESAAYDHSWDRYANNVIYNQLTGDRKQIWDALNVLCLGYLNSTEDKSEYLGYVQAASGTYDSDEDMVNFFHQFKYSNPQYFFLSNAVSYYPGRYKVSLKAYSSMTGGSARAACKQNFEDGISILKAEIDEETLTTEEDIVKAIHDVICNNVVYNQDSVDNGHVNEESEYTQSAYSTFVFNYTVCAGYSMGFALLCNDYGIDCMSVTAPGHAYDKVKVYDSWYNIDTTWDDQSWGISYRYYLKSDSYFASASNAHVVDPEWNEFVLPCT